MPELRPVVVTPGLGELADSYGEVMRRALAKPGTTLVDLRLDAEDRAVVVIAVAVAAVSGSLTGGGPPNGVLIGVRSAEQELYPLLGRGPAFAEDSETLLVARAGRHHRVSVADAGWRCAVAPQPADRAL